MTAIAIVLAVAGCGADRTTAVRVPAQPTLPATSSNPVTPSHATSTHATTAPATTAVRTTRPPTTSPTTAAVTRASRPAADLLVTHLVGVGSARQVISVTASGYGTSYATLQGFTKTAAGWTRTFGPWTSRIGHNGFAPAGAKREGDGRTPTGAYGFSYFYGVNANPGVRYSYRRVTSTSIVWDDDPSSPNYNLWVDTRTGTAAGKSPEPMYNTPSYYYGAVIAYNTARTAGLGSAIFLHQFSQSGGSTAGCVSLPQGELLTVLRWLNPAQSPVIVMGTQAAVTR